MKAAILSALLATTLAGGAQAAEIGVSVGFSQPGIYGRVDIGPLVQPALIVPQPVVVAPPPAYVSVQPAYMWVPPAHRLHWAQYCGVYNACRTPVYFVRDDWYNAHVWRGYGPYGRPGWRGEWHGYGPVRHAGWHGDDREWRADRREHRE